MKLRRGIIETRYSDDQPRDEHGRWTSGGSGGFVRQPDGTAQPRLYSNGGAKPKGEKTKYSPSDRANKEGITINPKTFVKVRSEFNTQFPNAEKGRTEAVTKGSYKYNVTADGYGSIIINYRYKK